MTQQNERLPALGDDEALPDGDSDFASEHSATAVDPEDDGEQESPKGRSGMADDGAV